MEYKLQILSTKKLFGILLPAVLFTFLICLLGPIANKQKQQINIYILIPMMFISPMLLGIFLQKKLAKTTSIIFNSEGILINKKLFQYSEIEGYRWETNVTMDGLGIKLKDEKVVNFTISKLDKPKSNFSAFKDTFDISIKKNTIIKSEMKFSVINKQQIWFLKPMVWIMAIILIGLFGYAILKGIEIPYRFYLLPMVLFTLYLKAYK
mgnify:FL=1